jgi:SPP1 family predicted phage head-tail adaptor
MAIGPRTSVANRPHRVILQNPGPPVRDSEGGFTETWTDLVPPTLTVEIKGATAVDLERLAAGTVIAQASHIVTGPYHPQVTTKSRLLFNGRVFNVVHVGNPEERNAETVLLCSEVVA